MPLQDSEHWDWGKGYCKLHHSQGVPCPVCIKADDLPVVFVGPTLFSCTPAFEEGIAKLDVNEFEDLIKRYGEP